MKWFWAKIGLGALGVFLVGYAGWVAVRRGVERGHAIFNTSETINIPLAFIPFTLDGRELGTFQRVRLFREAPRVVSRVSARIRLADGADLGSLSGCRLTAANREDFDLKEGFLCLRDSLAGVDLVEFGHILFVGQDGFETTLPLLLDSAIVSGLRTHGDGVEATVDRLQTEAEAAREEANRIRGRIRVQVDSAGKRIENETPAPPVPPGQ